MDCLFINSNDYTNITKELPKGCRYETNDRLLLLVSCIKKTLSYDNSICLVKTSTIGKK